MKKILMLVTMIMMLAVSAVCSASNGKVLDEEEVIVHKFDLDKLAYDRLSWGLFRDRRPDIYEKAIRKEL